MKKILIFLFLLNSCASTKQNNFEHSLASNDCEGAVKNLPNTTEAYLNQGKTIGTAASYTLAGIGYGADVTVFIAGTGVISIFLCSPLILSNAPNASGECVGKVFKGINSTIKLNKPIGERVFQATQKWRCPDLTEFSKNLRGIASCYENRNDLESLEKSFAHLELLKDKDFQNNCIDEDEIKLIQTQYDRVQRLKVLQKIKS